MDTPMTLPAPSAILFDWDNTLVNTWPVIHKALHDTFTHFEREPWTLEEVKHRVAKSMRDSFPELFGERWQEAGDIYVRQYRSYNMEMLEPLPDALHMLQTLHTRGIPLGIVSNKKSYTLNTELDHLGWRHLFRAVVGSDDAASDKPTPAPIELAMSQVGLPLTPSVWFVGDSHIDLECAANCNMIPIFYGDETPDTLEANGRGTFRGHVFHAHAKNHQQFLRLFA